MRAAASGPCHRQTPYLAPRPIKWSLPVVGQQTGGGDTETPKYTFPQDTIFPKAGSGSMGYRLLTPVLNNKNYEPDASQLI